MRVFLSRTMVIKSEKRCSDWSKETDNNDETDEDDCE